MNFDAVLMKLKDHCIMHEYSNFLGKYCRCPKCDSSRNMIAAVQVGVQIYHDGKLEGDDDVIVDKADDCTCGDCGFEGRVSDFVTSEDYNSNHAAHDGRDESDKGQHMSPQVGPNVLPSSPM